MHGEQLERLAPYDSGPMPAAAGLCTEPPRFPCGPGGLVSTLADWHRFGRMLLEEGAKLAIGGTGTTAHVEPASATVGILYTQQQLAGPTPTALTREFLRYAFTA